MTCVSPSDSTPERCLSHTPPSVHRPALSLSRALEFFFDDVTQDLVVQRQVCIHLLELAVLFLQLLQATNMADIHAAILRFPFVQGRPRYTVLTRDNVSGYSAPNCLTALTISVSLCLPFFMMTKLIVFVNFNSVLF